MKSLKESIYKSEWKKFWKNPNISDLEKIFYRMEFDTALECYETETKKVLEQFFISKSEYFPEINENLAEVIDSGFFESGFFFSKTYLFNRLKISIFFNSDFKGRSVSFLIVLFLFLFSFWILEIPKSDIFNNQFQSLILGSFSIYFIWIILTDISYFGSRINVKGFSFRDKFLDIYIKIIRFISFSFRIIFIIIFFLSIWFFIIEHLELSISDVALELAQFSILALFDFCLFAIIEELAIYFIHPSRKFLYFMFWFINSIIYSHEVNKSTIPFVLHKFLTNFDKKMNKTLKMKIKNIKEVESGYYQILLSNNFKILKNIALDLQKYILNPDNIEIDLYINLNQSSINKIVNILEKTHKSSEIPKFSYKRFTFTDLILDKYRGIITFLLSIIGISISVLQVIIKLIL